MKKRSLLKIIGIVTTAISGTILTLSTGGLALPLAVVTTAQVAGALGTSLIIIDSKLNQNE